MSATIDGARVASLLGDAPVVESAGRAFPVETRYVGRDSSLRIEEDVTRVALRALAAERGSILVFLPGQGEIARAAALLEERIRDPSVDIVPLFGAMDRNAQEKAIAPSLSPTLTVTKLLGLPILTKPLRLSTLQLTTCTTKHQLGKFTNL